jgi:hypothetical protein
MLRSRQQKRARSAGEIAPHAGRESAGREQAGSGAGLVVPDLDRG